MRFLRDLDYNRQITTGVLDQITGSSLLLLPEMELVAQAEVISYLRQRYDINSIFRNLTTGTFNMSDTFYPGSLVEYSEATFDATATYVAGNRVVYSGNIYTSIAGSSPHAFNSSEWTLVVADKLLYYVTPTKPLFVSGTVYAAGDQVTYTNFHIYTCTAATDGTQDPTNTSYWTDNGLYSITGIKPTDATKWTQGDNRNALLVTFMIDISLYHLHSRINPRNIPELRMIRYDGNGQNQTGGAIGWLKRVASGDINADLPELLIATRNYSIMYGSAAPKSTNTF